VTDLAVAAVPALALLTALLLPLAAGRNADRLNTIASCITAAAAIALGVAGIARHGDPLRGSWYMLDGAGAVFVLVIAVIGLLSALASPGHLTAAPGSFFGERAPKRSYYAAFQLFWAALLAIPLVDNLAAAWILIEATTAASALLVASGGRSRALEAGWKYLVLTTLGLTVALLGILVLYAAISAGGDASLATVDWSNIRAEASSIDRDVGLLALVLILGGLATKIGWAPVHNWLPDAHSEAPPPVSALLSAALLPTVMLVAWRAETVLEPAVGGAGSDIFIAFGVISLAVAVPFLWRPLPLKRLLAYSSLEHMGVLALGIGFATPLAIAGVVLHFAGHALAKSLGFYASIPLLRANAGLSIDPPAAVNASSPAGAAALGVSIGSLSGLPPSPLFFSEVLILLGGLAAGHVVVVAVAAGLLSLGFLGLAHALIEGVAGDGPATPRRHRRTERRLAALTGLVACALLALSATAYALPESGLIRDLMQGIV
jgi:hydrogenase-4 component F